MPVTTKPISTKVEYARRRNIFALILLITTLLLVAAFFIFRVHHPQVAKATQCGEASWYALNSRTASGEMMNPALHTAAHLTLPMGTEVEVTNLRNGKSITVRINDRGPYAKNRIIDLSRAAAEKLGYIHSGVAPVRISVKDEAKSFLKGRNCS